jgi:hypothetical protein
VSSGATGQRLVSWEYANACPAQLLGWLGGFGTVSLVGIEGTGSYGAGLARPMPSRADVARRLSVTAQSHVIFVARVLEGSGRNFLNLFLNLGCPSWSCRGSRLRGRLRRLREAGLPLALVTNTIARTGAWIAAALSGAGFAVIVADVLPAPVIAAAYLAAHYPGAPCLLLNNGDEWAQNWALDSEAVSGEMLDLRGELAARVAGVDDAARLEEEQRGFGVGARTMLNPLWYDEELPRRQYHIAIPHLNGELSAEHQEELVGVRVLVPGKFAWTFTILTS